MNEYLLRDLFVLATAFFENLEYDGSCEFGSIGVDCKRPFGNSWVENDILEMIGEESGEDNGDWSEEQLEYARRLYQEALIPYLKDMWQSITVMRESMVGIDEEDEDQE